MVRRCTGDGITKALGKMVEICNVNLPMSWCHRGTRLNPVGRFASRQGIKDEDEDEVSAIEHCGQERWSRERRVNAASN